MPGNRGPGNRTDRGDHLRSTAILAFPGAAVPGRPARSRHARGFRSLAVLALSGAVLTGMGLTVLGSPAHGAHTAGPGAKGVVAPPYRLRWLSPIPARITAHRDSTLLLGIETAGGVPVRAPVRVRMAMTAMPMGDVAQTARPLGPGIYRVQADLAMPGDWYALVTVGHGPHIQEEAVPLTVTPGPRVPWRLILPLTAAVVASALGLFWLMARSPHPGHEP